MRESFLLRIRRSSALAPLLTLAGLAAALAATEGAARAEFVPGRLYTASAGADG